MTKKELTCADCKFKDDCYKREGVESNQRIKVCPQFKDIENRYDNRKE